MCVHREPWGGMPEPWEPVIGGSYTVIEINVVLDILVLNFAEDFAFEVGAGWRASRFIKITPPEADAFDREVIEQMTGNPAKVGV